MFDSAGLAGWVETAMELASGTLVSFEESTRFILRDFAPVRQRRPDQGRDARESLNARDSGREKGISLIGREKGISLARFARALHTAIKKGRGDPTFSPREKVPRRGG